MTKQDDLFVLISSLTSNEKRSITLQSGLTKPGGKNYFTLYHHYLTMDQYSQEYLLQKYQEQYPELSAKQCKKRLADHKTHLFDMILKVIRFYNSERSIENVIRDLLQDAHFLMDRKLYHKGSKYIKKAKKKATEFQCHGLLIEILKLERRVVKEWGNKGYEDEVKALLEEEKEVRKEIDLEGQLVNLADQLFLLVRRNTILQTEQEKQEVRSLLAHPLLLSEAPKAFESARNYHFSKAMGAQLLREFPIALDHYKAIVDLFESHSFRIEKFTRSYHLAINNYLMACFLTQQFEVFPRYLSILQQFPDTSPGRRAENFQNYTFLALLYGLNKPDIKGALKLVPEIEAGMALHAGEITPSRMIGYCTNITLLAFVSGNLEMATKWNDKALGLAQKGVREDTLSLSILIHLVLSAEGQREDLYEECQKARKRLKPKKGGVAEVLLNFLTQEADDGGISSRTNWEGFRAQLEGIGNKNLTGYQEVFIWTESKITGLSLEELLASSVNPNA